MPGLLLVSKRVRRVPRGICRVFRAALGMAKATYKDAGVDLEVYRQSMARLPRLLHRTYSPRVIKLDGGFAGLFQLDFASELFAPALSEPGAGQLHRRRGQPSSRWPN